MPEVARPSDQHERPGGEPEPPPSRALCRSAESAITDTAQVVDQVQRLADRAGLIVCQS